MHTTGHLRALAKDFCREFALASGICYINNMSNARKPRKRNSTISRVDEGIPYGVYLWRAKLENGGFGFVKDQDGNFLCVPSMRNDREKILALKKAAEYYGYPTGYPYFKEGSRTISQEEWEHQKARQAAGLVPDPFDTEAMKEEAEYIRQHGK
jgi:hypothetical protein